MRALEKLSEIFSQASKPSHIPTLPPMPEKLHEIIEKSYHVATISEGDLKELHIPGISEGGYISKITEKSEKPEVEWIPNIAAHVICEDTGKILTHQGVLKGKNGKKWMHLSKAHLSPDSQAER